MVLSEDVQRAAFEGDLETITAWMASNDVNDTVLELILGPQNLLGRERYRSTLLKLILRPATKERTMYILDSMVRGVRVAGSWRRFINTRYYRPLTRLRGLANRGHATTEDPTLASLFGLPPRAFRAVLTFYFA